MRVFKVGQRYFKEADAFLAGFDTRESDGRDITNYLGLLEEGKDVQPDYGEELMNKLAGWAVGK